VNETLAKAHVMFVGRWQPCHHGHVELWRAGAWAHGNPALIYVRDIPPNDRNPFTTLQTVDLIYAALADLGAEVIEGTQVITGPDIAAIRYGRGVGYLVEEIELSADVQAISATEIRAKIKNGLPAWRDFVLPSVGNLLLEMDW
jgi:adenylylsulfate kinase